MRKFVITKLFISMELIKTNKGYIFLTIFLLALTSCKTEYILTNRYKSMEINENKDLVEKIIDIKLASFKKETTKNKLQKKSIFNLSEKGQKALIDNLSRNIPDGDKIIKLLQEPLSKQQTIKTIVIDKTEFILPLAIMIQSKFYKDKSTYNPANRIEQLDHKIWIDSNTNFEIVQINKIVNEFETINLGDLTHTNTNEFGIDLSYSPTFSTTRGNTDITVLGNTTDDSSDTTTNVITKTNDNGGGANAGISYKNTEVLHEKINLRQDKISTAFSFTNDTINIQQQAKPLTGISKNVIINVKFKSKNATQNEILKTSNYKNGNQYNLPKELKINTVKYIYTPCGIGNTTNNLNLYYNFDALLRIVKKNKGDNTNIEADDEVNFIYKITAKDKKKLEIDSSKFCDMIWQIRKSNKLITFKFDSQLGISVSFESSKEANAFLGYFKNLFLEPDKEAIKKKLTNANIIITLNNECEDSTGEKDLCTSKNTNHYEKIKDYFNNAQVYFK